MRHLLVAMLVSGCVVSLDGSNPNPPSLHITSPQRSLIQSTAGSFTVTGTVAPNPEGAPLASVTVNGTAATISGDGTFSATIDVPPGASLIHTVATDRAGGTMTDTRSIEAGQMMPPGSNVPKAVVASLSANAFTKISAVVTNQIKTGNLTQMLAPANPIVHSGDPNGPDCLYAEAFVDSITLTNANVALAPASGGISINAELDGLDVKGHLKYAVACIPGTSNFEVSATSATFAGVLDVAMNGTSGLALSLANPNVQLTGLSITATGVPGQILNLLPIAQIIQAAAPILVQVLATPLLNKAAGALTAPQKVSALGQTIDIQVAPSAVAFDPTAATITLDMKMLIEGTESSPGFTFTPNGTPTIAPGDGLELGLADDLANEMLAELTSTGLLNLPLPSLGGPLDASIAATSPPMISADPSDGKLRLILPDLTMTFTHQGTPVAHAAINAQIDVAIHPGTAGSTISIDLGTPAIAIDMLDSNLEPGDLGDAPTTAAGSGTSSQIGSITQLLQNIPLPQVAGLTLTDTSVTGDSGYLMIKTTLQ
jgi:hypothetical protein